jgi:hypothetical protein
MFDYEWPFAHSLLLYRTGNNRSGLALYQLMKFLVLSCARISKNDSRQNLEVDWTRYLYVMHIVIYVSEFYMKTNRSLRTYHFPRQPRTKLSIMIIFTTSKFDAKIPEIRFKSVRLAVELAEFGPIHGNVLRVLPDSHPNSVFRGCSKARMWSRVLLGKPFWIQFMCTDFPIR